MANYENIINSCVREMQAMSFIVSSISILLALLNITLHRMDISL